ncbi:MAG: SusF/SusE family outer membrane protein [Bacteroidales bacterium]|nr:SusF/SusE family outer membrane protein [Bacteroidales bacterium]
MKITKYFLSMAAAIGMIAGCQKPEMVQISAPEDVVAPVLSPVADINITAANLGLESVTFEWSAADFGAQTQVNYAIEVAAAGQSDKVVVTSGVTETSAVVSYESLNAVLLYDLGLASGIAENVDFYVSAKVGEYAKVYSAPVTASATVTQAEKEYPKLTVAGSYAYNNWSPGKGQFVYDFEGTDAKYSGVIDFGEDVSALQFKFVGAAWGENEFSVPAGEAQAAEAAELPLVAGGGDNISAYTTHRFYSLTLDKSTPKVIKNFSFNSLGVIGDATPTGWDADTDMEFNAAKQRFYVDLTLIDGKIKFRADDDWAVNWGGADGVLSAGGADIAVAAGNYRIYVNLNDPANPTYELNAKMYGQDENAGSTTPEPEPEPEPTPVTGWSLIGAFNEWSGDLMLASDGTFYVIKGAELEGELKFRKDGAWEVNLGLAEGAEFAADTEIALSAGGANINVAAGTYDVYLDEVNAKAWFITDGSYPGGGVAPEASEWGVVGQVNGWAAPDITMYKTATEGLFVAYNVAMPDGGFKIRANGEWNDAANYGLEGGKGNVEVDHAYDVITSGGSGDMILVAGNYDIWFDLTDTKVYIMTPGKPISEAEGGTAVAPEPEPEPEVQDWFLVGDFNGWTAADAAYKMTLEGDWYVFKGFVADGNGVKFVADASWSANRGGTFVSANEAIEVVQDGPNVAVAAGTYDVYLSKDASVAYFMTPGEAPATPVQPWYLVGDFNGWAAADPAFEMLFEGGWYVFKGFEADGNGVKFVADASWSANRGGTFVSADEAIEVVQDGPNVAVAAGTYDVYLSADASVAYFMTPGTTPAI